jgi:hypothetical protein
MQFIHDLVAVLLFNLATLSFFLCVLNQLHNNVIFCAVLVDSSSNFGEHILDLAGENSLCFLHVSRHLFLNYLNKLSVIHTLKHQVHHMLMTINIVDDHTVGLLQPHEHQFPTYSSNAR